MSQKDILSKIDNKLQECTSKSEFYSLYEQVKTLLTTHEIKYNEYEYGRNGELIVDNNIFYKWILDQEEIPFPDVYDDIMVEQINSLRSIS
ncbi:hypothetical protein LCGC14_0175170 [marine sediment metagenome]|uniref:Uncharacterized protein n=1 Tax=marine sediment metagenome TaxID=412755 RepID=A0A0F9XTP0_9ZZZZ